MKVNIDHAAENASADQSEAATTPQVFIMQGVTSPKKADGPISFDPTDFVESRHNTRYVARQPILDRWGRVHGYELLFRDGPKAGFSGDGDFATRDVLDQALTEGIDRLTAGLPAFVNCTLRSLVDHLVAVLPPELAVLEILETLEPTEELLGLCRGYKASGFRIALDDFDGSPEWAPFLGLADYVKVDISTTTPEERALMMRDKSKLSARWVAERVETPEDLAMVEREGFTLFQGYYFCKPVLLKNRRIPDNHLIHLQAFRAIHQDPLDIRLMADLVKRDPSLTYKLLRIVNSPLYAMRHTVTSIRSALVLVGDIMFRRVVTVAIASEINRGPSELLQMAFVRGRFCELAAEKTGADPTEQYLLGIVSLFPAMLGMPMDVIADTMPLRTEVREALMGVKNRERAVLEWLICFERGEWDGCDAISDEAGLGRAQLPTIYTKATEWAEENLTSAL